MDLKEHPLIIAAGIVVVAAVFMIFRQSSSSTQATAPAPTSTGAGALNGGFTTAPTVFIPANSYNITYNTKADTTTNTTSYAAPPSTTAAQTTATTPAASANVSTTTTTTSSFPSTSTVSVPAQDSAPAQVQHGAVPNANDYTATPDAVHWIAAVVNGQQVYESGYSY